MRMANPPDDLHEWISFEDPTELRTWVFDATFLRSNYRCIYGEGCLGILDEPHPELAHGCCLEHSTDENGHLTSRLREWKRRDWGEGGEDFHWWCTESHEAFVGEEPVYLWARDDIVELVGQGIYDTLVDQLERPGWVPLPHPALKR